MYRKLALAVAVLFFAGFQAAAPSPMTPDPAGPRPIAALDSVFLEELTWMEIRDALKSGKKTILVPTGGVEQNGPYLAIKFEAKDKKQYKELRKYIWDLLHKYPELDWDSYINLNLEALAP